jgi:hypothetical protein
VPTVTSSTFLEVVFGPLAKIDAELWLTAWELPGKRSIHVPAGDLDALEQAACHLDAAGDRHGVYIACWPLWCRPIDGRGDSSEAGALIGAWADIDIAGPGHAGTSNGRPLSANADQALDVLDAIGLPPTVVVHSGGGLQVWWALAEPWVFGDELEQAEAIAFAGRWGRAMVHVGEQLGVGVDNVGDATRVLRLPGTVNRKAGRTPAPVEIVTIDPSTRYLLEDLADAIPTDLPAEQPARQPRPPGSARTDGYGPADAIEDLATWAELFEPHGWSFYGHVGTCGICGQTREGWSHPGVELDHHGHPDHPSVIACHAAKQHSTSVPALPAKVGGYTRFEVFAALNWPTGSIAESCRVAGRALRQHANRRRRTAA